MGFEIQSTFKPSVLVCTTGISADERELIRSQLPAHVVLEDALSTSTNYLVTYKATMTEKYVQALKWNVRVLHVRWLYDADGNAKKYEMAPLEGANFTTSGVSNDSLINYHCLLGASFTQNLTISTDFLLTDSEHNDKTEFCKRYGIPIVASQGVFGNDYGAYKKEARLEAVETARELVFDEKVFFLDPGLPKVLFNRLRRLIISNGGTRVSVVDKDVDFIMTLSYDAFEKHREKVHHYQYVFDCVEANTVLFPGPYKVYSRSRKAVLGDVVCCIDTSIGEDRVAVFNKLRALGAVVKEQVDVSCTHLIVRDRREYNGKHAPYKVVLPEWVDQCLCLLRHVKEDKYSMGTEGLHLFSRGKAGGAGGNSRGRGSVPMLFQFTGLPVALKAKAIKRLESLNVKYSDTDRYERCSHLIMGAVSTSEKFLSCLCNGGWILRPEFVDHFDNSPGFDFGRYEWVVDENTAEKDRKVVASIRRWRERVAESGKPAFHRWVVRLYCEDQKRESYVRVIENGGGTVTEDSKHTHCFVSKSYGGDVAAERKYSTDYIFLHLFR